MTRYYKKKKKDETVPYYKVKEYEELFDWEETLKDKQEDLPSDNSVCQD